MIIAIILLALDPADDKLGIFQRLCKDRFGQSPHFSRIADVDQRLDLIRQKLLYILAHLAEPRRRA